MAVKGILLSVDPLLELRSIRRGGLMAMAALGTDPEKIRDLYSKHKSTQMLLNYLDAGSVVRANGVHTATTAQALVPDLA
jgi:uncharacterized pyridoxal phosphate-containing UPF0001 family protein